MILYRSKFVIIFILAAFGAFVFIFSRPSDKLEYVRVCDSSNSDCRQKNLPYQDSKFSTEERVSDLLQRMTLGEKIGQMALIEKNSVHDLNDIAKYGLGAMLSGSGAKPETNTPEGWLNMVNGFRSYSLKTRLGIPLLYGADANHGNSNVPGATIFPHLIGLGAGDDSALVRAVGKATAEETAVTGIYWIYSPNLDVAQDMRWGRTYETFGSDTARVSKLGKAFTEGLQSYTVNGVSIAAAAKHYVGNGAMVWGSSSNLNFSIDQGNSGISEDEMRQAHLVPFREAVKADVKSIMVGLNSWNGQKLSANKHLISDVLKGELGFQGLVFSDWYGVYEIHNSKYESLVRAVNAGVDMVMLPFDYKGFYAYMNRAVAKGDISRERLDDAVRRILRVKFEMGLFDQVQDDASSLTVIGSTKNRELARRAVRESLVVLKGGKGVLPVSKKTPTILVAGSAADNIGKQSGGWTVEWQGIDGKWIPGTSILDGIRRLVSPTVQVKYDLRGDFSGREELADIGIAVVGENPYAEGWGDKAELEVSTVDLETIEKLKKSSKKIVVIIISGRPLNIREYAGDWDAIVAAWLPGSEGQGVADVLFGDYPFTGTLPVAWELKMN